MLNESKAARELTKKKLKDMGIHVVHNARIEKIEADGIVLSDGRIVPCNVPVWATGAEA
jgi:NADH dehydrogenase FAD-containing subunit